MASSLYSQVTANRDANRKWSDVTVKDLLWNETSERVRQLIKAKEVSQDSIKNSALIGELEVDLIFSSEPSVESLEESLESILDLQRNGSSYNTRFSVYYIEALLNTIRHIKATCLFKTNEKKQSIKKTKKKIPEASPLVEIGIKTGLAFFINLLKRSSYIEGANELLTDMLGSMNDILSEFEPLTLYKNPIPAVGKTSLDKIVLFLQSHGPTHNIPENRELSISLLTNLTLQRGSLSSVLQCIQFIYSLEDVPVSKSTFTKLIQFFRSIVNELEEKIKGGNKEIEENNENIDKKSSEKKLYEDEFLDELCKEYDSKNNESIQSHLIAFLILGYCKQFSSLLLTPSSSSSSSSSSSKDGKSSSNTNAHITPRVFVCGSNSYGQIGVDRPTASETEEFAALNPVQIVAGCDCTFLLDQDGGMWARGKGDYGRLGTGDSNSVSSFKKMSGFTTKITYFCASQGSYGHGMALDENGDVWSWGDGDYGKLGHGNTDQTPVPAIIQALRGKEVKRISVGWKHSSAVTESGEVYTWGIGDSRLGFSNESQRSSPERITSILSDFVVKFTVCGDSHMFAVCDEGNVVFAWGDNSYGKLGTGNSSTSIPERVTSLDNLGIIQMACGEHHSLALTSKGEVYSWGISPACGFSSNTSTPTILDDLSGQKVSYIAASSAHSFAIVSHGSVYGWGSSDNGGPGVSSSVTAPTLIDSLEDCQIKQISGGFSHSVFFNIPSIYSSSTDSCLTPVEKSPFAIDLTKETFATLYNLLKTFENNWNLQKPFKSIENQSYYMESCLNILRANLYHANATRTNLAEIGLDPENSQILEFFREFLLHVLQTDHVSKQIKQISRSIFEDCWELLLPSLSLRISMLNNLLPKSNDDILKYSETESFLLGVIISSLIKSTKFAEYLHLDGGKISTHSETPFEADYSNLIDLLRTLISFLETVTLLSFHLEEEIIDDGHHSLAKNDQLVDSLCDVLTQLLAYLQKYVISLYVEYKFKSLELVVQTYIGLLFQSSLHILSKSRLIPTSVIKQLPVNLLIEDATKSIEEEEEKEKGSSPSTTTITTTTTTIGEVQEKPIDEVLVKVGEIEEKKAEPAEAEADAEPIKESPSTTEEQPSAVIPPEGEVQAVAEEGEKKKEEEEEEGEGEKKKEEEKNNNKIKKEEKKVVVVKKEKTYEEYVLGKLEGSVVKTLLPHLITSLVFFPKAEVAEMIEQLQSFLFGVDEINNLLFKEYVIKSEKAEYIIDTSSSEQSKEKEKEKDKEREESRFWLLEVERMTAALIGDFHYNIIRGDKESEEEVKYKTIIQSELFSNGLVGALGNGQSSSSNDENHSTLPFLKQLAFSEKNDICDHYYARMENYAREKWLMVPKVDVEYPAFVKLLRVLSASVLKHQGITAACMKVGLDRNSTMEVPKPITQLWDKLYQFREELFSQLTQKHPEILSTSDTELTQEELYEKESNLLNEFLLPVIDRSLFLFERVDAGSFEKAKTSASNKAQSFKDLVSDIRRGGGISELLPSTPDILRRSAPPSLLDISSPSQMRGNLLDPHQGFNDGDESHSGKLGGNGEPVDQIKNLRGSVVVKKGSAWAPLASVLNNLRKFAWLENNEIKDKSSIVGQIISFVKDHQNDIQSIEKAMKQQQVRAQLRFEGLEKLVGLFFDKELIESVRLQLIKGSFHLLCKGESPVSIEAGISAAPKSLQQNVVRAAHKLYSSLLNFAKCQLKLCANALNTVSEEDDKSVNNNSKVILTILLRALTVRFVPEDITVLINDNLLDILVSVMNSKNDWKECPLKRSATRLFKCVLSIIGLCTDKINQQSTLKTIQVLQELVSTALNENNQSIRSYLDLTRRTSVNSTYRKYFTSKSWLNLLLNMALNLPKTTDRILALRNLEVILPTLPIEANIQEINNIIEKLFSSITVSFYQLKGMKKTSTSKKLLFDTSKSSRCKPDEVNASKIVLQGVPNASGSESEEESIAYSYGNVCFTSGTYTWEVKTTSFKNEALGIGIGPYPLDSTDEEKNIFVFPQRSSGCINLPDDHQNFAEGDVVKFKLTYDSGTTGILYFAVNDAPFKKISNNAQMNVYPIVIMATDQSYMIEFDNYSHEQKNGVAEMNGRAAGSDASYCQEVVELLRNLHKNINWSPFINSHIRENLIHLDDGYNLLQQSSSSSSSSSLNQPAAPVAQPDPSSDANAASQQEQSKNQMEEVIKTSNIFTKSFGVLKMIGGVDNGLRRGGLVDCTSQGLGTIQKIFSTSPVAKVLSNEGDNLSILDLAQLNPIERCTFSSNSIVFDKDEIETLSQYLTINFNEESQQCKSYESQQFVLAIFKTMLTLVESDTVRPIFYDADFSIIIRKLLGISTTISPLKPVLSFSQLERTIFILYKTIQQQELQAKDEIPPSSDDTTASAPVSSGDSSKNEASSELPEAKQEEGAQAVSVSSSDVPQSTTTTTTTTVEAAASTSEEAPVSTTSQEVPVSTTVPEEGAPASTTPGVVAASTEVVPAAKEEAAVEEKKAEAPEGEVEVPERKEDDSPSSKSALEVEMDELLKDLTDSAASSKVDDPTAELQALLKDLGEESKKKKRVRKTAEEKEAERKSRRLTRLFEKLQNKLSASPLDEEIKEQILIAAKSDDQTEEGLTEILSSLEGGDADSSEIATPPVSDDEEDEEEEEEEEGGEGGEEGNAERSNENQEEGEKNGEEKEAEAEAEVSDEQKFLDNYFTTSVKLEELKIENEEIDNWINAQKDSFFSKPIRIAATDENLLSSDSKHECISNKEYLIFISKLQSITEKKKILYLLHKALQIQYSRKLLLNLLLLDTQQALALPIDEVLDEIIKFVVIIASGRVPETSTSDVNKLVENLGSQHSDLIKNIWKTSLASILSTAIRSINPSKSEFTSDDKSFSFSSSLTLTMAAKKLIVSSQQQALAASSSSMGLRSSSLIPPPELDEKEKEEIEKEKQEKMKELLDHLAACVLSDNIKAKDRTTAMNLIATQCYSSRDGEFIKSITSGKFTKILIDNVKNILEKQYKLERSAIANCSKATNSLFMQVMTAFAHIYPDFEIDLTSAHWQWFKKYKIAAEATESFVNRTALPKTLIAEALKKKEDVVPAATDGLVSSSDIQPLHDYEDNKKWTREMDEKLLIWQSKYPEHWKQPVEVFGFGKGDNGEFGSDSGNSNNPTVLDSFGRLVPKAILGGERSSFLLTEEGNVYCCGLGDYGRLGVGDTDTRRELTQIPELSGVNIVKMHSSRGSYGSSLALDILGNLWSWGDGDYGKLGHGNRNQYPTPAIISAFNGCDIAGFHCGFCHSAAYTKDGVLFTWGTGDYGRLGHGDTNTYETPKPIEIFLGEHEVCGVCCGNNFTIAFTNGGQNVWTFGDGDYGKLGHGDTQQLLTPKQVDFEFIHAPFIKAEAGEGFSVLLSKDGSVYSCGKGELGSLGHGDNSDVFIYTLISELQGKNIIDISVGTNHCLALSKDGSVYAWGGNDNGQLGLGSIGNVNTPTKIDLAANCKIASICSGSNHSFLCTAFKDDSKLLPDHLPEEFQLLESVFSPQLIPRVKILNKFSEIVLTSISLFNLQTGGGTGTNQPQSISFGIDKVVGLLRYDEKFQILKRFISHSGNSQDYGPVIQLNRWLSEKKKSKTIFYQTSELVGDVEPDQLKAKRAWKVEFVGEAAIDAGGPFNESISQICEELQSGKVPIFQLTPNGKNNVGYNRDCIIPQAFHSQRAMKMFKFFGRLLGIGVRCHSPLQLKLPLPFWKSLLNLPLTVSDLKEIDESFVISHEYLIDLEQEGVDEENFELLPLEKFKPLTHNGKKLELTFYNRKQYVKIALKQKIKEWDTQVAAIRKGLDEMIPLSCLKLFTPAEIEILVCGKEELNLKLLKSVTNYCGYSADSDIVQWLWEALEHFSPEDQGLFLRFVSGKTRLPHTAADFSHQFEIHSLSRPVADQSLPIAATCFFKLSLPSYSSKEILEKKLLFAIRHCSLIDTDNTGNTIIGLDSDDEEEELL